MQFGGDKNAEGVKSDHELETAPLILLARIIANFRNQFYTPALTCPPSQKVSQVEIEAGDSEGRLPHFFG